MIIKVLPLITLSLSQYQQVDNNGSCYMSASGGRFREEVVVMVMGDRWVGDIAVLWASGSHAYKQSHATPFQRGL